jgi:CDP-paratose 2-epimerase
VKLLITGGCGFLGANLAADAMRRGMSVTVFDNLSRVGSELNRAWLATRGAHEFVRGDVRDRSDVDAVIARLQPDAIFHLAGQVAMTTSLADPRADFEINAMGTLNVLEAVRYASPRCAILYSSTNKVYGDLEQFRYKESETRWTCEDKPAGFDEATPLEFQSPYGCSKGAADQYCLDFARVYGLRTAVFRHSSMYGGRQFATFDQGWIGWFCAEAVRRAGGDASPIRIAGDGKQVRDVLHADDMIALYFAALERIDAVKGQAFNVGGGMANSLSLLELFALLESVLGKKLTIEHGPARDSDQRVFVADLSKATRLLGWQPKVNVRDGIRGMVEWTRETLAVDPRTGKR